MGGGGGAGGARGPYNSSLVETKYYAKKVTTIYCSLNVSKLNRGIWYTFQINQILVNVAFPLGK